MACNWENCILLAAVWDKISKRFLLKRFGHAFSLNCSKFWKKTGLPRDIFPTWTLIPKKLARMTILWYPSEIHFSWNLFTLLSLAWLTAQNVQNIKPFDRKIVLQICKSGCTFSWSEPLASHSNCHLLGNALCLCIALKFAVQNTYAVPVLPMTTIEKWKFCILCSERVFINQMQAALFHISVWLTSQGGQKYLLWQCSDTDLLVIPGCAQLR